jgi:hypothetical protein
MNIAKWQYNARSGNIDQNKSNLTKILNCGDIRRYSEGIKQKKTYNPNFGFCNLGKNFKVKNF